MLYYKKLKFFKMRKVVLIIAISFFIGFLAFTDMIYKISEKDWFMSIVALKVAAICGLIFLDYYKKIKTCKDDLPKQKE